MKESESNEEAHEVPSACVHLAWNDKQIAKGCSALGRAGDPKG